ncbi:MAG: MBL fold metallo-hydrolase, partial [Bacilli bacterium]|nr:MBL fold metallo-hydrolase [Bacilli bacterium]
KIYVAGDTDYVPFMEELAKEDVDYALLPIDGIYNMGPEEASRVAGIIKPKHLIPYHMKPGQLFDIKMDMRVSYPGAMLVRPGDEITL